MIFIFRISEEYKVKKEQHLFEIEVFCNIISVFTFTFDQFNAFLLNKNNNFFLLKSF